MPEYRRRFRKKMNKLYDSIENLSELAINNYENAVSIYHKYSDDRFRKVEECTKTINDKSREIESECVRILATEQPVARDLKFIENALKMAAHLRRIARQSFYIARVAKDIDIEKIPQKPLETLNNMANNVDHLLKRSIRSFLTQNTEEASELEEDDEVVDDLFDEFLHTITDTMKKDSSTIDTLVPFILTARYFESIADRSERIGRRVILMEQYQNE